MRKDRPYKRGKKLTSKHIRYNIFENEKRLSAYDSIDYGHSDGEMYLSDGVSVSGSTWAIMQGYVKFPYECECGGHMNNENVYIGEQCDICKPYNDEMIKINKERISRRARK